MSKNTIIMNTANVSISPENTKPTNPMNGVMNAIITACNTGNAHAITALEGAYAGASSEDFSK